MKANSLGCVAGDVAAFPREDDARRWLESVGRMPYSPTIDLVEVPLYSMWAVKPAGAA